jgi:hypothetical protein
MPEPTPWSPLTVYSLGNRVIDSNGAFQQTTVAGTSGASAPAWNTGFGLTTLGDGGVTWTLVGYWTTKFVRLHSPGPYDESLVDAIAVSTGSADAGKVILANALGQLDSSFEGDDESGTFSLDDGTFTGGPSLFTFDDGAF